MRVSAKHIAAAVKLINKAIEESDSLYELAAKHNRAKAVDYAHSLNGTLANLQAILNYVQNSNRAK
jgi:hypothetical protein